MFEKNYYCLVSGLKEYVLDADHKGFDARTVIEEVRDGLSCRDRRWLEMFYFFYDIENIIRLRNGRRTFSPLGNFTPEELAEQIKKPSRLPAYVVRILTAYDDTQQAAADDVDTSVPFDNALYAAYYEELSRSKCRFLREWGTFDRNLRNLIAAFAARSRDLPIAGAVVGGGDVVYALTRSAASDFGLRGELGYIDQVMQAVLEDGNLLEKEYKIDLIRWNMADELTVFDYFNLDGILGYLVKINLVQRWAVLEERRGREMFRRLVDSLGSMPRGARGGADGVNETKENNA